MGQPSSAKARFEQYVARLGAALGHADRREPFRAYLTGLLLPGERKSVEPMAAKVDPRHVRARHQSMHHLVANAPWDDHALLAIARDWALEQAERHALVTAWVVDDTGMPKKGTHSAGVARQYCGVRGKQENCQVAVSVSLANPVMSVPAGYRLYLPEVWAQDRRRRRDAGVPDDVQFRAKWQLALQQIDDLLADELPRSTVVADAGYGDITAFRDGLTERHLTYVVGAKPETSAWPPGQQPLPPKPRGPRGPTPRRLRRSSEHRPLSLLRLATTMPKTQWRQVRWREGIRGMMRSRFAAVRVRPAHGVDERTEPRPIEWLLIEWPSGNPEPAKYWFSTLPEDTEIEDLVRVAKIRWRIERDYQELKDEIGLDHYEGRGWRGFHHHGALCICAYAFLAAERARLSPPEPTAFLHAPAVPKGFRPRGAAPAP